MQAERKTWPNVHLVLRSLVGSAHLCCTHFCYQHEDGRLLRLVSGRFWVLPQAYDTDCTLIPNAALSIVNAADYVLAPSILAIQPEADP